jgi:hypothetical protein
MRKPKKTVKNLSNRDGYLEDRTLQSGDVFEPDKGHYDI